MNRCRMFSLSLLLLLFCCKGPDKEKNIIDSPNPFDKVRLTDVENNSINLGQYKGKTIFINFWATWCKPCIAEMPSIQKAQDVLRNEDVVFFLASNESSEEINSFRNTHNYNFNYTRIENSEELNIQGLPTTFIFDPKGQLVFAEMGSRKWDEKANIDLILKIADKK